MVESVAHRLAMADPRRMETGSASNPSPAHWASRTRADDQIPCHRTHRATHITVQVRPLESFGCKTQPAFIDHARSESFRVDADSADAVYGGVQTEDLLTRAVIEALSAGRSWAHIATQLGVPAPATCDHLAVTDRDWQEAIVAHENARAARLNDQTWIRRP